MARANIHIRRNGNEKNIAEAKVKNSDIAPQNAVQSQGQPAGDESHTDDAKTQQAQNKRMPKIMKYKLVDTKFLGASSMDYARVLGWLLHMYYVNNYPQDVNDKNYIPYESFLWWLSEQSRDYFSHLLHMALLDYSLSEIDQNLLLSNAVTEHGNNVSDGVEINYATRHSICHDVLMAVSEIQPFFFIEMEMTAARSESTSENT